MSTVHPRKAPRCFVINPISDRRVEVRFNSTQAVQIFEPQTERTLQGHASDIGRRGLKLECDHLLTNGETIQITFPETHDAIHCYGHVVWTRAKEEGGGYHSGIEVHAWHGIVAGPDSWQKLKGVHPKRERRRGHR